MSRIRKIDSYKSAYLPMNKVSHMNAYGSTPTEAVNQVDSVPPMNNELTQLNKYEDTKKQTEKEQEAQNKQQPSHQRAGYNPLGQKFETVTLHLERYEQMRKDQQKLKEIEKELSNLIQFLPKASETNKTESYRIRIDKESVKSMIKERIRQGDLEMPALIDESDISFS